LHISLASDRPYLHKIYNDNLDQELVFKKSAQVGLTERMISEAAWLADQFPLNALYFFPTAGSLSGFVQERLDDPINNSAYLCSVIGRAKGTGLTKQSDSIAIKRLTKGYLHFKGTSTPTQMTSTPGDAIFVDELDRIPQINIPYLDKRMENSALKWSRWASTPTMPNFGIDKKYKEGNQQEWNVKCDHCGHWQHLNFWDNVIYKLDNNKQPFDCHVVCVKCKKVIVPYLLPGEWVAAFPDREIQSYFIHQLYSPTMSLKKLVKSSLSSVIEEVVQFYNQNLGLAYEPKGVKLTDVEFENCKRDYRLGEVKQDEVIFGGFDVGSVLHFVIKSQNRVIDTGSVDHFFERDDKDGNNSAEYLIRKYKLKQFAVDAMPESRNSVELCQMFPGRGVYVYYNDVKPKKDEYEEREGINKWIALDGDQCNANRTVTLDYSLNEIRKEMIELPKDIDNVMDFKEHLKALVRVKSEDKNGNPVASYEQIGPDHTGHAYNYATIAAALYDGGSIFIDL